jgi:hypothetical protein
MMSLTHESHERLLEFAYGELSAGAHAAVQAHVDQCDACRTTLEQIRSVRSVMGQLPQAEAPTRGLESLMAYATQTAARNRSAAATETRAPTRFWAWATAALTMSAVVLIGWRVTSPAPAAKNVQAVAQEEGAARRDDAKRERQSSSVADDSRADKKDAPVAVAAAPQIDVAEEKSLAQAPPVAPKVSPRERKTKVFRQGAEEPALNEVAADYRNAGGAPVAAPVAPAMVETSSGSADKEAPQNQAVAAAPPPSFDYGVSGKATTKGKSLSPRPSGLGEASGGGKAEADEFEASKKVQASPSRSEGVPPVIVKALAALESGATGQTRADALKTLCDAFEKQGDAAKADLYCDTLLNEFPKSAGAQQLAQRRGRVQKMPPAKPAAKSSNAEQSDLPAKR